MEKTYRFGYFDSHIVHEDFDDEIVVINLKSGIYYSLSKTGQVIWNQIRKNPDTNSIISNIKSHFDTDGADVEGDVSVFLKELESEELIKRNDIDRVPASEVDSSVDEASKSSSLLPYEKPLLNKYTDQKELLLLDPIHEVDDIGWPQKSSENNDEKTGD